MVISIVVDATTLASQGLVLELLFSVIRYYSSKVYFVQQFFVNNEKNLFYHCSLTVKYQMAMFFQCEKEFHVGCLKENNMEDLKVSPYSIFLCSFLFEW